LEANALVRPADDVMAREAEVLMLFVRTLRLGHDLLPPGSDLRPWTRERATVLEGCARQRQADRPLRPV
jgi:hypothetical protein